MIKAAMNRKIRPWLFLLAAAAVFGFPGASSAQSGSFYVGGSGDVDFNSFEHAKTVDNSGVPESHLQKGNVYSETDSASKTGFAGSLIAGWKLNLEPSGTAYVAVEIDGRLHTGNTEGTFTGKGQSAGRNQYGELWPDKWTVDKKFSYGATVLLGANPQFLTSLLGPGAGLYALGGVRRLHTEIKVDYNGCLKPDMICPAAEFSSGTNSYDKALFGWTLGAGLEKMIGMIGIRAEMRHTRYRKQDWETFGDTPTKVPVSLDGNETNLLLGAVLYF